MKNTMTTFVLAAAALLVGTAPAQAQATDGHKAFVSVNFGVQLADRSISTTDRFPLYDEVTTVATSQPVSGGAIFDIGGGVRVWRDLFVGLSITSFSDDANSTVSASIPDPLVFDRPRSVSLTVADLKRREVGTHLQIGWVVPVIEHFDVAVSVGPSFVRLEQDFVTTVTIARNTQNATPVVVTESGTGVGVNVGVDGTYTFTRNVGAGVFLRYVKAAVDLDSLPGSKTSGVQLGVGARIRF